MPKNQPGIQLPTQPRTVGVGTIDEDVTHLWRRFGTVPTVTTLPTAGVRYRARVVVLLGGAGVADTFHICLKAAGGTYSWRLIITG